MKNALRKVVDRIMWRKALLKEVLRYNDITIKYQAETIENWREVAENKQRILSEIDHQLDHKYDEVRDLHSLVRQKNNVISGHEQSIEELTTMLLAARKALQKALGNDVDAEDPEYGDNAIECGDECDEVCWTDHKMEEQKAEGSSSQ